MARIETLKNVIVETGRKLYRESTIKESTKALYDFRWEFGGGGAGKSIGAGTQIKDLTYNNRVMTNLSPTTVNSKGGILFEKSSPFLSTGANNFPKWGDSEWVLQAWLKFDAFDVLKRVAIFSVGLGGWDYTKAVVQLLLDSDASGNFTQLRCGGLGIVLIDHSNTSTFLPDFDPLLLHLYSIKVKTLGSSATMSLYIDNVLIRSFTATKLAEVTGMTYNIMRQFAVPAVGADGVLYRTRFDLIDGTAVNADDLIASEYAEGLALYSQSVA